MGVSMVCSAVSEVADAGLSGTASWRDLGFLASAIQFLAATIFWVSTMYVVICDITWARR